MQMQVLRRDTQGKIELLSQAAEHLSVTPRRGLDSVQVKCVLSSPTETLDVLSPYLSIELRLTEDQAEWLAHKLECALQDLRQRVDNGT